MSVRARYGIAVVAVAVGIVGATAHDVAWADTGQSGQTAGSADGPGPKKPTDRHPPKRHDSVAPGPADPPRKKAPRLTALDPTVAQPESSSSQRDLSPQRPPHRSRHTLAPVPTPKATSSRVDEIPARSLAPVATHDVPAPAATPVSQAAQVTPVVTTTITPTPPAPLSPIARVLQLPGRIVNAVLKMLDVTVTASGPRSPLNLAPINDFLFGLFRRVETELGLDKPPAVQHVLPTLTYEPPDAPVKTPTVAQFLNASTVEYVLGGVPGGMVPLTVHGFQMQYGNIFTGSAGRAWVTPDQQIVIAYQGTTGGTNLLFNPLMAIGQTITDLQVVFTDRPPPAFTDALRFAQKVQAEAVRQGYGADDVFVTGHSLGAWQAQYVAQRIGLAGVGFEGPGLNTAVPGNGAESMFVNIATYGDVAPYLSTDLPGMQSLMPPYVPAGGTKPHYGPIVMIGDPQEAWPVLNASAGLWSLDLIRTAIYGLSLFLNAIGHHLPGVQAYHLDVDPDPGVVPWYGFPSGTVHQGWGQFTIPELKAAASDAGRLIAP